MYVYTGSGAIEVMYVRVYEQWPDPIPNALGHFCKERSGEKTYPSVYYGSAGVMMDSALHQRGK